MTLKLAQRFLPYGCQDITDEDIAAVTRALRSERITQGPEVEAFEAALCEFTGAKHALAVSNGTAALHLAYAAIGLGEGDEIITTPITFAATANAARYLGAEVRFADVDAHTGNIDPTSVEALISDKTRAVVAVHLGGLPCDMHALRALCDARGLYLIEDAAHALGATYAGVHSGGGLADLATFSFHPVKHLTCGEGGAVLTNQSLLAEAIGRLRHHGVERDADKLQNPSPGPWYYEVQDLGFNYRLTDFQCALGRSQLTRQDKGIARRREIAARYRQALRNAFGDSVHAQPELGDRESSYHLFPVAIDFEAFGKSRKAVMESLAAINVGTQVHYIPVPWQPYYQQRYGRPEHQPGASHYYHRTLSLPMFPGLSDAEVDYVVTGLLRALTEADRATPAKVA